MKRHVGLIRKMRAELKSPVEYHLPMGDDAIPMNTLLGQKIQLCYTGEIYCVQCARKTAKSFQQGYCFPCYRKLLECNLCIIHPEKCRIYEGVCSTDWSHAHCNQPHVIYLANSSGLKVGITRTTHIPTRWIDQGAAQGLVICYTQNRYQAGLIEVALKQYVADKTNWRIMLKSENALQDLMAKKDEILVLSKSTLDHLMQEFSDEIVLAQKTEVVSIAYPILEYPKTIKAFNLDKNPLVEGTLLGIKGQYLLLDTGVISIRKYAGYMIEMQ